MSKEKELENKRQLFLSNIPGSFTEFQKNEHQDVPITYYTALETRDKWDKPKPVIALFEGKKSKPKYINYFDNKNDLNAFLKRKVAKSQEWQDELTKRKNQRNRPHKAKVGDIFYNKFGGWDEINNTVQFYRITKIIGKKTVEMCYLQDRIVETEIWESGEGKRYGLQPIIFQDPKVREEEDKKSRRNTIVLVGDKDTMCIRVGYNDLARLWDGTSQWISRYD
jgi:hypothetical protein